jgi:FixJ family two-component response regulator
VLEQELGSTDVFSTTGTTRQVVMSLLYQYGGLNNRQIAELMHLDYSTVSQGRKRLRRKIETDRNLTKLVEKIEEILSRIKI